MPRLASIPSASLSALFLVIGVPALAEPTTITVRAQSQDAKYIGDHMGGVAITLTDQATGKVLAQGLTKGGTGDTQKLVVQPIARGAVLSGEGDAGFTATVDIDQPTLVRLEAKGPQGHANASITVSSMSWVLPGQPVVGDGWIVAFPGLVVEPTVDASMAGQLTITAKVSLMCGCPVTPGGLWDADGYTVTAWLDGAPIKLAYAGEASTFRATVSSGGWRGTTLMVTAVDTKSGNTGVGVIKER